MATVDLLKHYIEYITSLTVLLTILLLVGPILYTVRLERSIAAKTIPLSGVPGCRRLGLTGRSNLSGQHEQQSSSNDGGPRVKALFTYPIKSCRGVELAAAEVETTGLKPKEGFKVGFADAFPVNILGLASVRATDAQLPPSADVKGKLDARRFRANIYVSGIEAFGEDTWKKITVGRRIGRDKDGLYECDAEYHVACRTARCKLPNVDPDTGIKDSNEPYTTLGKTRKVDKGAYPHPCLGMQTIPLFERGIVRVGDVIQVLESGEHCYEKMFA
ncbi:hypothetical protein LTR32_003928 [Rachicladosporium monterosium]|uniref:MOSC domain-containing protein n=1 Tax=Rachicladosporium monterosium TaxID=1507873 RepID=A0ABR0L613_9PEZI|nr:hypothetical protein LTR32_003928 [Rachicladosporium monterosium]